MEVSKVLDNVVNKTAGFTEVDFKFLTILFRFC